MAEVTYSNKRIARNTVFLYVRLIIVLVVSLFTVRIVLNALGVTDYGVYNVVGGFVLMFGFLNSSLSSGTQRFYNYEVGKNGPSAVRYVFNAAFRVHVYLAVAVLLLTEGAGIWYLNRVMVIPVERLWAANWIYQFAVVSLVLNILCIPYSAAIMAHERMDYYAMVGVADTLLKLGVAWVISLYPFDRLLLYGLMILLVTCVSVGLYMSYCLRNFPTVRFSRLRNREMEHNMLAFSGWNALGSGAYMMRGQGVNLLLNFFWGAAINAAYGVAGQVSGALQQFSANLVIAFKPQLTLAYSRGDAERTRRLFFSMMKVSYAFLVVLAIPVVLELDFILNLWLGGTVPEYTGVFCTLIIISMLVGAFHTPITQLFYAIGNLKAFQLANCIIVGAVLPVAWVCVYCFHCAAPSVFWVMIVLMAVNVAVSFVQLRRRFPITVREITLGVFGPCVGFTLMSLLVPLVVRVWVQPGWVQLLLVCLTSVTFSLGWFYILLLSPAERHQCGSYLKKALAKIKK